MIKMQPPALMLADALEAVAKRGNKIEILAAAELRRLFHELEAYKRGAYENKNTPLTPQQKSSIRQAWADEGLLNRPFI